MDKGIEGGLPAGEAAREGTAGEGALATAGGSPVLFDSRGYARYYKFERGGKTLCLKTPKDKSGECLEMLRRDFERSKTLKHPCLETCYEFLDDSPVGPAIVMDYVPCRTLREYIAENPSRKDRRRVLGQLLDVTAYCHSKGVLLNDLSPMTVMVAKEGDCVRLSGFGITPEDAHLLVKSKCMNWDYSSKELRNRARDIDVRSDIFSIGKIMSELLDGSYKGISRKCASKNPAKRFDSVDGILASMEPKKSHAWVLGLVLVLASILGSLYYSVGMHREAKKKDVLTDSLRTELAKMSSDLDSLLNRADAEQEYKDSLLDLVDMRLDRGTDTARFVIDTTKSEAIARDAIYRHVMLTEWIDTLCNMCPENVAAQILYHYQKIYRIHYAELDQRILNKWGHFSSKGTPSKDEEGKFFD